MSSWQTKKTNENVSLQAPFIGTTRLYKFLEFGKAISEYEHQFPTKANLAAELITSWKC